MHIDVREPRSRQWMGRINADPSARPTRLTSEPTKRDVYLAWDGALDDAGQLRKCLVCGCGEMYYQKAFPQVTGIVIVLAFAGAAAGVFGFVTNVPVLIAMFVLLVADVGILLFSKKRLVCYRCASSYHQLPIARYHKRWDRAIADRHARAAQSHPVSEPKLFTPIPASTRVGALSTSMPGH